MVVTLRSLRPVIPCRHHEAKMMSYQQARNESRRSYGRRRRVDDDHSVTTVMGLGMAILIVVTMLLKL